MDALNRALVLSATVLAIAAGVHAQNGSTTDNSKPKGLTGGITHVVKSSTKMCTDVGCVIDAVDQARKSNDRNKMHSALDMAYDSLSSVKNDSEAQRKIATRLQERLTEIETQMQKVKDEQQKLDNLLFRGTDNFIITE